MKILILIIPVRYYFKSLLYIRHEFTSVSKIHTVIFKISAVCAQHCVTINKHTEHMKRLMVANAADSRYYFTRALVVVTVQE